MSRGKTARSVENGDSESPLPPFPSWKEAQLPFLSRTHSHSLRAKPELLCGSAERFMYSSFPPFSLGTGDQRIFEKSRQRKKPSLESSTRAVTPVPPPSLFSATIVFLLALLNPCLFLGNESLFLPLSTSDVFFLFPSPVYFA